MSPRRSWIVVDSADSASGAQVVVEAYPEWTLVDRIWSLVELLLRYRMSWLRESCLRFRQAGDKRTLRSSSMLMRCIKEMSRLCSDGYLNFPVPPTRIR
jgi:hypothetical protein